MTGDRSSFDSSRAKLASFHPGHVFLMPQGATWLNRDKARPFALATSCNTSHEGVLAYGSTRETEMWAGATSVEVMPNRSGLNANGLHTRTLFYPGVLFPVEYSRLPPHLGVLGKSLPDFKRRLWQALGIGTGTCLHPEAPAKSRRGRIVRLDYEAATVFRTRFAVLLTEHLYSREDHYHLLLPILRGDSLRISERDLLVTDKEWLRIFSKPTDRAVLPIRLLQSAWYASDVAAVTSHVIDESTLERIEAELCNWFGLRE